MTVMYAHTFSVEGRGQFPHDMLRYDRCHPCMPQDVNGIFTAEWMGRREIRLCHIGPKDWEPTIGRWNSWQWNVYHHEKEKV